MITQPQLQFFCLMNKSRATEKVDEPGVRASACAGNDFFDSDDYSHGLTRLTAYWNNGRRAQQRSCLQLMRSMMDTGDASIMVQFGEHGAIPLLRKFIARPFPDFSIAIDQLCVQLRTDAMLILSSLCDFSQQNRVSHRCFDCVPNHAHVQDEFGPEGMKALAEVYLTLGKHSLGGLNVGFEQLIVSAIACVWAAIVGSHKNRMVLIENSGIFLLMDTLDYSRPSVQSMVLGCLLDLLSDPMAVKHTMVWRSSTASGFNSQRLFIRMYLAHARLLKLNVSGLDLCPDDSKMAHGPEFQVKQRCKPNLESKVVSEVFEYNVANIFYLLERLEFEKYSDPLLMQCQVILVAIKEYLTLRRGDVWAEICDGLKQDGLDPVEVSIYDGCDCQLNII